MLKSKTALVTGSTSGIGLALAKAFAGAGCNIVLNGFGDASAIETLRSGLARDNSVTVTYSPADMSKGDEIAAMVADAEREFGAVDILCNNAGIQHVAPIDEFPVDKWSQIIAINLVSSFHSIRAALPGMKKKGWGRIVNMASVAGTLGGFGQASYSTTKAGVLGLTRTLAMEGGRHGITCNAIVPGVIGTEAFHLANEAMNDRIVARTVLKRPGDPQDVANAIAFLCSDLAHGITGEVTYVDAGYNIMGMSGIE